MGAREAVYAGAKYADFIGCGVPMGIAAAVVGVELISRSLTVGVGDVGDLLAGIGTLIASGIAFATLWMTRRSSRTDKSDARWSREEIKFLREVKTSLETGKLTPGQLGVLREFVDSLGKFD
ncbi:hypothetical protein, partial [Acrocarpospora corrugata]|uniref:hypothetical protein n=1 Tax=Acrocarpospora corrugata TaxID=35763 RepID=UPI001C3FA00F